MLAKYQIYWVATFLHFLGW